MDIKKKLQSLVKAKSVGGQNLENDITHSSFGDGAAISKFKEHVSVTADPRIDQEIISSIEAAYFTGDGQFDSSSHELQSLSESALSLSDIETHMLKLKKQLKSVSKKVSELILGNHQAYATELQRVMELQQSLQTGLTICTNSRSLLKCSQQEFTISSLCMLANHRKRQQLQGLMRSLRTIKTLQRTDVRLREMLEKEDYAGAIELCLECQKAASIFRHYTCISELSSKLQDTLDVIEEQLDTALSKTCNTFDAEHYSKIQQAYFLLEKLQICMDQLMMHFSSAIHNVAFTIVLGYVELCCGTGDNTFQKKQYPELCKYINYETFIPCLKDLCKALWNILVNYHKTRQWHQTHDKDTPYFSDDTSEAEFNRKYVEQKLDNGRGRLWQEIQLKVRILLLAVDMSSFKFNEFTHVINLINRLVAVGEEFAGAKSEILQEAMHKQTQVYFQQYHASRIDEIRMFLENEGWELVPVRSSFTVLQLQEFSFIRSVDANKMSAYGRSGASPETVNNNTSEGLPPSRSFFSQGSSPFDEQSAEDFKEDFLAEGDNISSESDDGISEDLKREFIDEEAGIPSHGYSQLSNHKKSGKDKKEDNDRATGPVLTNTSLSVLRLFGKYMWMVSLLEPIAFEVITSMSKLLDYYLHAVYTRFAAGKIIEDPIERKLCISSKLQTTLQRVTTELQDSSRNGGTHLGLSENSFRFPEKLVAVESLIYLAKQFEFLQPYLEKRIPLNRKAFLQQFYSQTITTVPELRYPVYLSVTEGLLNSEHLVSLISSVKYEVKDIMSQHSAYVDVLLREFHNFSKRLADMGASVPVSSDVLSVVWQQCGKAAAIIFVEGFSCVKKCTPEGRALMQLDFQHFVMNFEKISDIRPIPGKEYVETYIKAYYLPEDKLETWVKDHKEYTGKQLANLVNCMPQLNKKSKQKILSQIEDPDKASRKEALNNPLVHIQNLSKKHLKDMTTS